MTVVKGGLPESPRGGEGGGNWPGLVLYVPLSGVRRRDLAEGGVYEELGAEAEN